MASDLRSDGPFGLPRYAIWGAGVLVFFLISFGIGFVTGSGPVGGLTERLDDAEGQGEELRLQVESLNARLHAQRALSLLYRANLDLDARNFGTANERLNESVAELDQVDAAALGVDAGQLQGIRAELAQLDIRVAEDLAGQRTTVADLTRRLALLVER